MSGRNRFAITGDGNNPGAIHVAWGEPGNCSDEVCVTVERTGRKMATVYLTKEQARELVAALQAYLKPPESLQ